MRGQASAVVGFAFAFKAQEVTGDGRFQVLDEFLVLAAHLPIVLIWNIIDDLNVHTRRYRHHRDVVFNAAHLAAYSCIVLIRQHVQMSGGQRSSVCRSMFRLTTSTVISCSPTTNEMMVGSSFFVSISIRSCVRVTSGTMSAVGAPIIGVAGSGCPRFFFFFSLPP
jgi:hypothetical protein